MINNTTYASKATAVRGAKRAGIVNPAYVPTPDGRIELRDLDRPLYNGAARERSTVEGPVGLVWSLCIELGASLSRKELIAKCVDAGVNINTARTQYQLWSKVG